jgi:hypothetical protein
VQSLKVAVSQRGFWDSCFVEFAQRRGFLKGEKLDVEFFHSRETGCGDVREHPSACRTVSRVR